MMWKSKRQYQVNISNRFAALENLHDDDDMVVMVVKTPTSRGLSNASSERINKTSATV